MDLIDSIIDRVKSLPPAPRILPELLAILAKDDADAADVVRLIRFDPALTAQVLRRCNGAAYGFAEPAHDLQEAVMRVGMAEIYRVVGNVVGERTLGAAQRGYGIGPGELWKHCAVTAVAARVIAAELGANQSVVFTAALLHDIGKLILGTALENDYAQIVEQTEKSQQSFLEAEKTILGVDHAEVGGRLLTRWNFPESLVNAVRYHHDPLAGKPHEELAAYVHLGDVLAHMLGHGYGYQAYAVRFRPEALDVLKLTATDLDKFMIATSATVDEMLSA